ncbi:hypothetical protein SEPCBS57363_000353 [Sporothrix epigloea]|uniref:Uncharacterized protein n=1 Tax=Sporothrix epigloea TaxID=1892477 RepID=A0ABP0D480_9PEZI
MSSGSLFTNNNNASEYGDMLRQVLQHSRQLNDYRLVQDEREAEREELERKREHQMEQQAAQIEIIAQKQANILQAVLSLSTSVSKFGQIPSLSNVAPVSDATDEDIHTPATTIDNSVVSTETFSAGITSAYSNATLTAQSSKSPKELRMDYVWYARNGYRECCPKPVDEQLVELVFPLLTPSSTTFGSEQSFHPADHPKDGVSGLPVFKSFDDVKLHHKIQQAQTALLQRSIPLRYWAFYLAPRLQGDFCTLSHSMTTDTPWYRCVFAIICQQGLRVYCNHRERDLLAEVETKSIIKDLQILGDAYSFAPLVMMDGQGRLETYISSITVWNRAMGHKLCDQLQELVPQGHIDGPGAYLSLLRHLSSITEA